MKSEWIFKRKNPLRHGSRTKGACVWKVPGSSPHSIKLCLIKREKRKKEEFSKHRFKNFLNVLWIGLNIIWGLWTVLCWVPMGFGIKLRGRPCSSAPCLFRGVEQQSKKILFTECLTKFTTTLKRELETLLFQTLFPHIQFGLHPCLDKGRILHIVGEQGQIDQKTK